MKKQVMLSLLVAVLPLAAAAQPVQELIGEAPAVPTPDGAVGSIWDGPVGTVLVDSGPVVTSVGTGAGGADESILENLTLGLTTLGITNSSTFPARNSDQFDITDPDGWRIDTCTFFNYQTGAPATTSPITDFTLQVWDGDPSMAGATVVFGDTSTNRLLSSDFANIYRLAESTPGDTNRAVFANVVDVGGLELPPGTYWLDWNSTGSAAFSGPWAPPITIIGQTSTGDGLIDSTGVFVPWLDGGLGTPLGYPFICEGEVLGGDPPGLPIPTINGVGVMVLLLALAAAAFVMMRRRQTV